MDKAKDPRAIGGLSACSGLLANGLFATATGVGFVALQVGRVFEAVVAEQHQVFATKVGAVSETAGRAATGFALTDGHSIRREVDVEAVVEDIE